MDERDKWVIPPPTISEIVRKAPFKDTFRAQWGVDYQVIMGELRQNSRESRAKAALFEKLGAPITPEDIRAAFQIGTFSTAPFWDRLTAWKIANLPRRRRWQLRFMLWRSKFHIGGKHG